MKVCFTGAAVAGIAAPIALPYSPSVSAILEALAVALVSVGGVVHAYWDHSP